MDKAQDNIGTSYFRKKGWKPFEFQKKCWDAYLQGKHGLLNAPTGSGKTYAIWFGILQEFLNNYKPDLKRSPGLQALWITPVRALAEEIYIATTRVVEELEIDFEVGSARVIPVPPPELGRHVQCHKC